MNTKYNFIGCCVFYLMTISSCNLINPEEDIPSYIKIDSISLSTNYTKEGSNSHKIKDAWLYIDNNPVGVYELPCNIPILEIGKHVIDIRAGILQNGIAATRLAYPFYQFITRDVELTAGQSVTIENCATSYFELDTFPLLEDFETGGPIEFFPFDSIIVASSATEAFEGNKSGKIKLAAGQTTFEITSIPVELAKGGNPVYLEMNYKNDVPFVVGLQAEDFFGNKVKNAIITVTTKSIWNKIYIELAPTIALTPNAYRFSLVFGTQRIDTPEACIYFDNLKIVHN